MGQAKFSFASPTANSIFSGLGNMRRRLGWRFGRISPADSAQGATRDVKGGELCRKAGKLADISS